MEPMTESAIIRALFLEGADLDLDHPHGLAMAYDIAARIQAKAVAVHNYATGNDVMRAVCDEPIPADMLAPFAADVARTVEARKALKGGDRIVLTRDNAVYGISEIKCGATGVLDGPLDKGDYPVVFKRPSGLGSRLWVMSDAVALADAIPTETPQEAEQMDEIEARQIDRAHPAVLDMATFAADSLGLGKGA